MRILKPDQVQIVPPLRSFYGVRIWEEDFKGSPHVKEKFLSTRGLEFRIRSDIARPCRVCGLLTNLEEMENGVFVCGPECVSDGLRQKLINEAYDKVEMLEDICSL